MTDLLYFVKRVIDKIFNRFLMYQRYSVSSFFLNSDAGLNRDLHDSAIDKKIKVSLEKRELLPTVTAVFRVKNAEQFIALSIQSIIPLVKEIIVVDNNSSDKTVEIVEGLGETFKNSVDIKVFSYKQVIARAGQGYGHEVSQHPDRSIAKFYTHCFSKASSEYVLKVDAHCIYSLNQIARIQKVLSKGFDVIYFRGIEYLGKSLSVEPYLFKSTLDYEYKDTELYEVLQFNNKSLKRWFIFSPPFLHLKRIAYVKGTAAGESGLTSLYGENSKV